MEFLKSTCHQDFWFKILSSLMEFFMCMLRLLQKKEHVLTADIRAKRCIAVMCELFMTFQFLGTG